MAKKNSTSTNTNSTMHGGSSSTTVSHSETNAQSHSEGGSHSESYGKSWASGKVDKDTQEHFDKHKQDYVEGSKVNAAYDQLQQIVNGKPKFESSYEDQLNGIYQQIMNRDKFNYDFNADPMYKMYKDNYTKQGEEAMRDTMGQASAMTGGYGSSYAQTAGQQAYQKYLQQVNGIIPELRNQAYQQYQDEGRSMMDKYGIASDAYNREYGQYRDDVSDWQADRGFQYGMYADERNFDYGKYRDDRNFWQNEYWQQKNAEHSNYQTTDTQNWQDTTSHSTTDAVSHTDSENWQNASSNSNSSSFSFGGGGGGGSTGAKPHNAESIDSFYKNNQTDTGRPKENYIPYNIKKNDTIVKYEDDGIVDDLVGQLRNASNSFELAQIYYDLEHGFNFKGHNVKLSNAEMKLVRDKAFGNGTRW